MPGRIRNILFIATLCLALSWPLASSFAYLTGKPHDLGLANPKGHCLNCHDPHQPNLGAGFAYVLKRANEIAVCYQCHAGALNNYSSIDPTMTNVTSVYAPYDIRTEFNKAGIHFPNHGMDGEVNRCSECHNPHGVFNSRSTVFNPNSTLKLPMLLSAGVNAVTNTDEFCLVCHNSDPNPPNPPFSNITVPAQFKFSRTVYHQMRHSTFARPTSSAYPHSYDYNPYGTGKDISCLTCHRPHGSPNNYMLKDPDDQYFCLTCHNGSKAPDLSSFNTSGHGKAGVGRICQDCHFPHGTGQKNALKKLIQDPNTLKNMTANVGMSPANVNEACFACHSQGSVPAVYYSFDSSIAGWTSTYPTMALDTTTYYAGGGSLKQTTAGSYYYSYSYTNPIAVPPGTPYTFYGYYYIPANITGGAVYVQIQELNATGAAVAYTTSPQWSAATGIWQRETLSFTTNASTSSLRIFLYITGTGAVYWDEIGLLGSSYGTYFTGKASYNSSIHKTSANALNPLDTNGQAAGDCDNCHNPHGTSAGYTKMMVDQDDQHVCFDCHNSTTPNTADKRDVSAMFGMASHHDLTKVACRNCHNVHAVTPSSMTMDPFYPSGAVSGKNFCLSCHGGTMPAGVTGAPNIAPEWANNGHDRTHILACSDCHESHGSPNPHNLRYTTETYGTYSAQFKPGMSFIVRAYCEACHNRTGLGYKGAKMIPTGPGYMAEHLQGDTTPCANCHSEEHNPDLGSYTTYYNIKCLNCHTQYTPGTSTPTGNPYPNVDAQFNTPANPSDVDTMKSTHPIIYRPYSSVPTVDCVKCHGANHEKDHTPTNKIIAPDLSDYTGVAAGNMSSIRMNNRFCLECHDSTPVNIGGMIPPNIQDTYTGAGHGHGMPSQAGLVCAQCHEYHGSVNQKLVKTAISGSPVSSVYSGINVTVCTACHKGTVIKGTVINLPLWPGYSVYSGSIHAFGNRTTGNLVSDGRHGPGVCMNCHNPHGAREAGKTTAYMTYKKDEDLCYRCHASGFDNFSTPGDYNNKWDHFGTFLKVAKENDPAQPGGNKMALHLGQTGGQGVPPTNTSAFYGNTFYEGVVSSNAFPDDDATITVKVKIPVMNQSAGYVRPGAVFIEDANSSTTPWASLSTWRYVLCTFNGTNWVVWANEVFVNSMAGFGDEASAYHTVKFVRTKAANQVAIYIDNTFIANAPFAPVSGRFRVRLCAFGSTTAATGAVEAWFDDFSMQYADYGSAHNTSSGDDVQARFYMKSHHKISDADQADGSKVECTDCHDPHTITEKLMAFKNISDATGLHVIPVDTDQEFCLKCHDGNPPEGVRFPPAGVWDKSQYTLSAHGNPLKRYRTLQPGQTFLNYSNGVTYPCKVCHNPHGSNQVSLVRDSWDINRDGIPDDINGDGILDSATQVGYIGYSSNQSGNVVYPRKVILVSTKAGIPSRSAFKRVSTTIPYQPNGAIDVELCLNCHDGRPAPDVKSEFMKQSHHPVEYVQQVALGGAKVECYNCHDQHRAQARNDAADEYPTTNPAGQREPMPGDAAFCLKCHDTSEGNPPPGVLGVSFGSQQLKNIKLSYNPNNLLDTKGYDVITTNAGHHVQATGKPMMCRDCHNQHGSNYPRMLRDDTEPGKPGYDSTQPIQNMRPVALAQSDPYSGNDSAPLSSTAERCLSCHSGKTTYKGSLIPLPPPPNSRFIGFSGLPEVGKHPDVKQGLKVNSGLTTSGGHLYSATFAVSTSCVSATNAELNSVKDSCTTCHDSHAPLIQTYSGILTNCYNCHNANTSLPDVQTEFDANPLNPARSKSYHPINYNPRRPDSSGVECLKCHDQSKHMQGHVRLRKDPSQFKNYTSDKAVWVSQPTSGGFLSSGAQPFTNGSTVTRFCLECHGLNSTVASTFNGGGTVHNPPRLPFGNTSGAHFTNGRLVCTNCHEYHGSVNTMLKRNSFATGNEPTPTSQLQSLEGSAFCYGCHNNPANSKDNINVLAQFSGTASHHQVGASEQTASSRLDCTDCHNVHIVTRAKAVVMAGNSTVAAVANDMFCLGCHDQNGKKGVQFPGFANGTSGPEWDPATGKWNRWNKQAFLSSPHSAKGVTCRSCHDPHGSSNYRLLLTTISTTTGIKVSFGAHSTVRGKRTEEIGVNRVCAACHKSSIAGIMGGVTTIIYPGYASYTSMTFGRKTGVDKNCTYCHNPHGTSQTRFGNDTSPMARMMRANRPLYMNMTSSSFGSVYNFKGFSNGTTGAPYYMFCSSAGCHASESARFDTFSMSTTVDRFNRRETVSSHHPLKEGVLGCTSCHKEHGTSTAAADSVSPDLRAAYFRGSNWPKTWHSGVGPYRGRDQGCDGRNGYETCNPDRGMVAGGVMPPAYANNLCFMCHQKDDIIGTAANGMSGTNTRFLGHEAVAGGAPMTHQISPGTPLSNVAGGEYHNFSCSMCHFPHTSTQGKLLKTSCFSQSDSTSPSSSYDAWGCHPFQKWADASNTGWRNLTTSAKTLFNRPPNRVTDLAASISQDLAVNLTWTAVANAPGVGADHYNVYRSSQPITQDTKPYATRISRGTDGSGGAVSSHMGYTDITGQPNTTYYYAVVACDSNNNESFVSNCATARLGADTVAPNAITTQNVAQVDGTYNVKITWNDPGDNINVTQYKIYRKPGSTPLTDNDISSGNYIGTVNDTDAATNVIHWNTETTLYSYTDTSPTLGDTYSYAVVALDAAGNVSHVPTAVTFSVNIVDPAPAAVTTLAATPAPISMNVNLGWNAPANIGAIASYKVYRDTQQNMATKTLIYTTPDGLTATYTDTVPSVATTYYYMVTAVDASSGKVSVPGNVASVNIPAPPSGMSAFYNITTATFRSGPRVSWAAPEYTTGLSYYNLYWRRNGGAWTPAKIADNLAPNGGMENSLAGWYAYGITAPSDKNTVHGGIASAKITGTYTGDKFLQANTQVPVLPSKSYTYSGWVYVPQALTGGQTTLRVIEYTSTGAYVTEHEAAGVTVTSGWVRLTDTWTTNAQTGLLTLRVQLDGIGTAWWDDLTLTPPFALSTSVSLDFTGLEPGSYDVCATAVYGSYGGTAPYESLMSGSANLSITDTAAPDTPAPTGTLSPDLNHGSLSWNATDNNFTGYTPAGIDHYQIWASYDQGATWNTLINSLLANPNFASLSYGGVDGGYANNINGWSQSYTNMYAVSDALFDAVAAKIVYYGYGDGYVTAAGPAGSSVANQTYSMSFWAKASKPTTFQYFVQENGGGWQAIGVVSPAIGTTWQRFTTSGTFTSAVTATSARVVIRPSYDNTASVTIGGVRLCAGTDALQANDGTFFQPAGGSPQSFADPNAMAGGGSGIYRAQAVDAQGNCSSSSSAVTVYGRPKQITDLAVTSSSATSGNILAWSASSSLAGLKHYYVYAQDETGQSPAPALTSLTGATRIGDIMTNMTSSQVFLHDAQNTALNAQVGHTYAYAVISEDVSGVDSAISTGASTVNTVLDRDGPAKADLHVSSPVGTTRVYLAWNTPYDNVGATTYQIYRLPTSSVGTPVPVTDGSDGSVNNVDTATAVYTGTYASSVPGTFNSYSTTWYDGLGAYYAVRSYDIAGNASPVSNSPLIVVGKDTTPPNAPVITRVSPAASPEVDVYWLATTDVDDQVSGYALYRLDVSKTSEGCITPNNIGLADTVSRTIPYSNTSWADTGGTAGTTYYYGLRAYDTNGNWSNVSNCWTATVPTPDTDHTPPTWPSGSPLTVIQQPYPDIDLVWDAATDKNDAGGAGAIDHYAIYRSAHGFNSYSTAGMTPIATVSGISTSYIDKTGYAGSKYYYGVIAVDASANHNASALSNVGSAAVEAQPCTDSGANKNRPLSQGGPVNNLPTIPGNLTASTGMYPYINLNWTASTDVDDCNKPKPLNYYKLYRSNYPLVITDANKNDPSQVVTTIIANDAVGYVARGSGNAQYNYAIEAFDMAGNASGLSNEVMGQVAPPPCVNTTPPSAPVAFALTIGPCPDMDFTWTASTPGGTCGDVIDHYNLYRNPCTTVDSQGNPVPSITTSTPLSSITPIRISGNSVQFVDSTGTPNTAYSYVLTAVDSSGNESGMSDIITKTTAADRMPPAAINDLKATASTGMIQLSWCRPSDDVGVDHYDVYRVAKSTILLDADVNNPANKIATSYNTGTCLSYNDTNVTANTTYSYAVIAVDAAGNRSTISFGQNPGDTIATYTGP